MLFQNYRFISTFQNIYLHLIIFHIMTTKEKIIKYLKHKNISKREFYTRTGLSNGFLDSGKHLGTENLALIINNFPDLNIKWIVLDEGNMIIEAKNIEQQTNKSKDNNDVSALKLLIIEKNKLIEAKDRLIEEQDKLLKEKERLINILINTPKQSM